ncbi:MAG: type I-D CRISPR-associated protein Cas5/Csc1 [Chloroflexota bacterium]|nr:type I-D CRISPR-associated protein Cas5/Csc1 [Chloroflexota bacterium]
MFIYRCDITLQEATFFSSREIGSLYGTEPLIGNYALAYAFGYAQSRYHNDGGITYKEDLGRLNEAGLYITPASFVDSPRFLLRTFNAQTDAYWSAYGAGVVVGRTEFGWSERRGQHWYTLEPNGTQRRHNPTNRPQEGRIRMLAAENWACAYVLSTSEIVIPRYIRLGKFMSKARVESRRLAHDTLDIGEQVITHLLNPADLSSDSQMSIFDLVNVPPVPLVRNARVTGRLLKLEDGVFLPAAMHFGVEHLP